MTRRTLEVVLAIAAAGLWWAAVPALALAGPVTAVAKGATWNYLAGPADPGIEWRGAGYDDSAWPSGPAMLGYGEASIQTTLPYGPSATNKWRTTYFRIAFDVQDDPSGVLSLWLDANYDDGFVAYLNGVEVQRAAMPPGPVTYDTFASSHESGAFERYDLSAFTGLLQSGANVLAVEVHQTSAGSSDLALDMALTFSSDSVNVTRGPYLQVGTQSGVVVRWRTDRAVTGVVRWGPAPGDLTAGMVAGASGTEHELALTGLAPGTRYWYGVGTPDDTFAGDSSHTFRTAPPDGAAGPARIWIVGDSGLGNQNARDVYGAYRTYAGAAATDLWLMLGDNAYGSGTDAQYQAGVFDVYPELLRSSVVWPTRGNHDLLYAGLHNDYYDIFTMPAGGEAGGLASGTEAYYSFDHGHVHFVCLDSEGSDRSIGGAMLQWLRADLAATAQPWIVAYWHHPPYSKGSHDSDDPGDSGGRMRDMRQNVLPILDSTGVDLVLTGHSHAYERSFLLNGHYGTSGSLTIDMKIDAGDGRAGGDGPYVKPSAAQGPFEGAVYTVAGSGSQTGGGSLDHPVMVQSLDVLGSVVIDVQGQRMDVRFLDDAGAVRDSFAIVKGPVLGVTPAAAAGGLGLRLAGPNPAAGPTRLDYTLPVRAPMRLSIVDVGGRRVATLAHGTRAAGRHAANWDGTGADGRTVRPGVYYALLEQAGDVRAVPLVRLE